MKKPHLYILCGLPFAGKTTLAKALVGTLGINRVAIDDINTERGVWDDEIGLSPEEWTNTYNEAYRRIGALLSQGESVIDDSVNFTRNQRDRLREVAQRCDACTTVIYVNTSLSEAQRRWQENRQTAVRADVRDNDFAHVIEYFEPPTEDEQVLRYDGAISVEDWICLTFLREARDNMFMMRDLEENKKFELVTQRVEPQGRLLRVWELKGGVSALVTGLEVERPDGQTKKMIVRQHGELDLRRNPQVAADEFRLLQLLHSEGVATPTPYYLDQSGEIFSTPYVVIEYIEGETEFALAHVPDFIPQFTTQLAGVHQVDCAKLDVSFLPQQAHIYAEKLRKRPAILDESLDEGRIRDVLEAAGPLQQRNKSVLLHGDFWPGNVLWKDGRLVGVIDWEDAASGDPLADIATSRLEVLWAFGSEAMHAFTHQYQAMSSIDFTDLPYWDLFAALRPASRIAEWAGNAQREKSMREGHCWFITQVFERLAAQANQ